MKYTDEQRVEKIAETTAKLLAYLKDNTTLTGPMVTADTISIFFAGSLIYSKRNIRWTICNESRND